MLITDEKAVWEKRLNETFKKKEKSELDSFMSIVSMVLYNNICNEDIAKLYSCLDLDTFLKVVTLFECRTVEFPSKKDIKESLQLALFYYYRNVEGITSYEDLKKLGIVDDADFSSISIGKRISKLNKSILQKLENIDGLFEFDEKEGDDNEC